MELDNLWKAEHWDPEKLMQLYAWAGAKYFVALANHHDNFDADEIAFLAGMGKWMDVNSDAIFATRPWVIFGEGPSAEEKAEAGQFGGARDVRSKPYTAEDMRFTTKAGALYAFVLEWPTDKTVLVKSLATGSSPIAGLPADLSAGASAKAEASAKEGRKVTSVTLLGYPGKLTWTQDATGLHVQFPDTPPSEHAVALKITGVTAL
jgi:alpha-L-fucosidase